MTRRFQLAPPLTRDTQTSAGNGGDAVSCELRTTTGGIQAVLDTALLLIIALVVAFLFISALTD